MIPILSSLTEHSILQQPQSQSQFLGREAVFQCTIEVADLIPWRVDDMSVDGSVDTPGLKYSIDELNPTGPVKTSNLTMSAIMNYHEKDIYCTGIYINGSEFTIGDTSQQAMLQVQGMFIHVQKYTHRV